VCRMKGDAGLPVLPSKSSCTGCCGCANACPVAAIHMVMTGEGFYHPGIDAEKCTRCGLCTHHCPVTSPPRISNRSADTVRAYAAWTRNDGTRFASSSGGVFSALARLVLGDGGMVSGAAWSEDWTVSHVMVATEKDLASLRGSKYLQSRVGDAYRRVVQALHETEGPVLFSGLPCQVAALRIFVEDRRLLTVDVVCHGVPSLAVFHKYLQSVAGGRKVTGINFRDKRKGWSRFSLAITFDDGSEYVRMFREDPFMAGFLGNLYSNEACYRCPFCTMPRQGDITLADYWGVSRELKSDLGVSLVLANNDKSDEWLEKLLKRGDVEMHETPFESAVRGNPRLVDGDRAIPALRSDHFHDLLHGVFGPV